MRSSGEKQALVQRVESHSKLDDHLKKLIDIIEYTTSKKCIHMVEKPELACCQVSTLCWMGNSNEIIFIENCFGAFEE
jgi:hypothetical protein